MRAGIMRFATWWFHASKETKWKKCLQACKEGEWRYFRIEGSGGRMTTHRQ